MNISLTPALEKFVNDKVSSGMYTSVSEVIREAIRLLISSETISQTRLNKLNKDIEMGLNDNETLDGNNAMQTLLKKYE